MEKEKKDTKKNVKGKNTLFIIIIIVLILCAFCLTVCMLLINKQPMDNSKNQNEVTSCVEDECENKHSNLLLIDEFMNTKYSESVRNYIEGPGVSYKSINDLSNWTKLWVTYFLLKDDMNGISITSFTLDEILIKLQSIFGDDFVISFEDITDNGSIIYKFNSSTNKYEYVGGGFGINTAYLYRNNLVSYEEVDGKIIVSYKNIYNTFEEYGEGILDYYNGKYEVIPSNIINSSVYDDYLVTQTYTFEIVDGEVHLLGYNV